MLTKGDSAYMRKAMKALGVKNVKIEVSSSTAKWPDIWVNPSNPPVITVTQEWARQSAPERQKRLTHELLHLCGMQHNSNISYDTRPAKDKFSKMVYEVIRRM